VFGPDLDASVPSVLRGEFMLEHCHILSRDCVLSLAALHITSVPSSPSDGLCLRGAHGRDDEAPRDAVFLLIPQATETFL